MRFLTSSLVPVVLVFLAAGGGPCALPEDGGGAGEVRERRLTVVLVGKAASLEAELRQGSFFRRAPDLDGWRVTVASAAALEAEGEEGEIRVVAGLLPLPGDVRALAGDLPVELGGDRVELDGTRYEGASTSLALRVPGADAEESSLWLVAAPTGEALLGSVNLTLVRAVGGGLWGEDRDRELGYEIWASRWLRRNGAWRRAGEGWEVDPGADRDDFADRERWLASLRPVDAGPVRLLVPPDREEDAALKELAAELGRAAEAMARRVPLDRSALRERPVTLAVEVDHVAQARHTGAVGMVVPGWGSGSPSTGGSGTATVPPDLHLVHHPDDAWAHRHALARQLLERGEAVAEASPWMAEGAALWLTGALSGERAGLWYGRRFQDWVPDLAAAGVLPEAGELLQEGGPEAEGARGSDTSEPLWVPVAASVLARLPGTTATEKLEAADAQALGAALAAFARPAPEVPHGSAAPPREAGLPDGWLRGVSLAASLSLDGAYHAPALSDRLQHLAEMGADAVSLMPFAFQPRPDAPELRFLNDSPTSETDAGLVHATRLARSHGFTVLWKPHLWVGHGSWPGEVAMTTEADWQAWWRSYRRYVLHHAVLAAYSGAELFAVGVELERTVERRDDWVELVTAVRRVYPGAVTYAANWGAGADRVTFWDAVDAAGVDAYYPLAEGADAGDSELRRGAEEAVRRLEAIARRAGKPLLLTEVGFPAREAAWREPHREGGEPSVEDQARAYRALLAALEGRPWLRGVFVWKAFSGEDGFPDRAPDFRFLGRPSEAVVARFFRRVEAAGGVAPGRP